MIVTTTELIVSTKMCQTVKCSLLDHHIFQFVTHSYADSLCTTEKAISTARFYSSIVFTWHTMHKPLLILPSLFWFFCVCDNKTSISIQHGPQIIFTSLQGNLFKLLKPNPEMSRAQTTPLHHNEAKMQNSIINIHMNNQCLVILLVWFFTIDANDLLTWHWKYPTQNPSVIIHYYNTRISLS